MSYKLASDSSPERVSRPGSAARNVDTDITRGISIRRGRRAAELFFGLRGLRWKREIAPYESDAWACPERPKWDTSGMENYGLGPYWCPPAKNGS